MKRTKWAADLRAVRAKEMNFRAFAARHDGIVTRIAGPWENRGGSFAGRDDLKQEVLIEIWRAIVEWESERAIPLDSYVRLRIRNRLLAMTHRIVKGRGLEHRAFTEQELSGNARNGSMVRKGVDGTDFAEIVLDSPSVAARVVGSLSGADAALVAALINGASLDVAARKAYGRVLGVRESLRRAADAADAATHVATTE